MDDNAICSFGEFLRQLRELLGFSIKEIAEQIDIDPSLLGKIERNERRPSRILIAKLAKVYNQEERFLIKHVISDQFANRILAENADLEILKVTEEKVKHSIKKIK